MFLFSSATRTVHVMFSILPPHTEKTNKKKPFGVQVLLFYSQPYKYRLERLFLFIS